MTNDRAEALALIEELFAKGLFPTKDVYQFKKRIEDLAKKFEFEAVIEESNEVTPDTNFVNKPAEKSSTDDTKGPLDDVKHDQVPKNNDKNIDLDF